LTIWQITLGLLCAAVPRAQPLALRGITHVAFRVADLPASAAFYQRLGFEQAFRFDDSGTTVVDFLKINDHQFIELYPRTADSQPRHEDSQPLGMMHICFEADDLAALRAEYLKRNLEPTAVNKARAGNLLFSIHDPEGQVLEYLQYLPGSRHFEDRGRHLGERRISQHLVRAVANVRDVGAARAFYTGDLGFEVHGGGSTARLRIPGNSGEEVELQASAGESGPRIVFAVPDVARATDELRRRGFAPVASAGTVRVVDPDGAVMVFAAEGSSSTSVADRLIGTPVDAYPFNWGEGVQMMGLMKAARAAHDTRYIDYVEKWARIYEAQDVRTLLDIGPAVPNPARRGYCGHWSPGSAVLYLYQDRRKPEHLKLAQSVADFIATGAERSPEGGLGHWQGSHQLWVDTLYMACPLLASLGQMQHRPEYIQDAAHQIVIHARHLQDEKTGLIYHMWDWQTGTHSDGFWGRGDGWVLMSLAETMEVMSRRDPKYQELASIARKLAKGLESTQDADGLWHTVLDDPKSYPECSATAMFSYGMLKLVRLRVLPPAYTARALKAWRAINLRYVKDGQVAGVSAGTDPKGTDAYRGKPVGTETWGTGAYLLAASEVARNPK
jgi:rhamnogalacturonyl hydrolase YesR/catechol 2,3-dioxygenase-like lactoylglutathione lyase family enzyme